MQNGLKNITIYFKFVILLASFSISLNCLQADENHYKNILVGDRAAGLGGAYVGISDDSSGAFYNPAGLSFAYQDSVSGSGNAYQSTETEYQKAIGNQSWVRDSQAILPNFFGMTKKYEDMTLALSYIVPDSAVEHQDQKYEVNNAQVDQYYISLHSDDQTNLFGPTLAFQVDETLAYGISLFYGYRIYRHQQHQFLIAPDGSTDTSYVSVKKEETFYMPKFGVQFTPFEPIFIGLTISKAISLGNNVSRESSATTSGEYTYSISATTEAKKYPTQISVGMALFLSPSFLVASDIDYFMAGEADLQSIMNYAVGAEWFMDADNAFRAGYYTNNDNRQDCTASSCDEAHIDMTGISLGYSSYTRTSGFTLAVVSSSGSGKADIYGDRSAIVDVNRNSLTAIFAANYNY